MAIVKRDICHCDICDHEWMPKKVSDGRPSELPNNCASCKSTLWNRDAMKRGRGSPNYPAPNPRQSAYNHGEKPSKTPRTKAAPTLSGRRPRR